MVSFKTTLLKFGQKGEKTGWTYINLDIDLIAKLKPNTKKSFRVKGKIDQFSIKGVALIPMGDGEFIMAINAEMRKHLRKTEGAQVQVELALDIKSFKMDEDFISCIEDDEEANTFFISFPLSHQHYFSKWITSAKTADTKAKRIVKALNALGRKMNYAEMIREK